ncbi:MAG: HAD family hydrolase [Nitrospirota bacterium]
MRYRALACDYDGTLATEGRVEQECIAALERLKVSGRKLVLVTGRQLEDLSEIFPERNLFDRIVAENGALIYCPETAQEQLIGKPPPPEFVEELEKRGVFPSVGRIIVATREPHGATVGHIIHDLDLDVQIILNKGAVMVLPAGVNKATGLQHALSDLGLSPHDAVGIGDAENDLDFLSVCAYAVAVANALPFLKERVDYVTRGERGAGVIELIDKIIAGGLQERGSRPIKS